MQAATSRSKDETSFKSQKIDVNGLKLNVVIAGSGPDVLLVHGFPDDHDVWRHQIPELDAAGYRVIAPDTRGCGESEMPPRVEDYKIDNLVADLVGVLDRLGIQKVRLVAHDWGAVQSWHFALRHPERVDRYITMSVGHPSSYGHGGLAQKIKGYYIFVILLRHVSEFLATRFNWLLFRIMTGYKDEFERWKSMLSRPGRLTAGFSYYRANPHMVLPRKYPHAKVPVIGIWSTGDWFLARGQMVKTKDYCDNGFEYVEVANANHWLQLSAPDKINSLLLNYLR